MFLSHQIRWLTSGSWWAWAGHTFGGISECISRRISCRVKAQPKSGPLCHPMEWGPGLNKNKKPVFPVLAFWLEESAEKASGVCPSRNAGQWSLNHDPNHPLLPEIVYVRYSVTSARRVTSTPDYTNSLWACSAKHDHKRGFVSLTACPPAQPHLPISRRWVPLTFITDPPPFLLLLCLFTPIFQISEVCTNFEKL